MLVEFVCLIALLIIWAAGGGKATLMMRSLQGLDVVINFLYWFVFARFRMSCFAHGEFRMAFFLVRKWPSRKAVCGGIIAWPLDVSREWLLRVLLLLRCGSSYSAV
ncbi:hypothetical signal peptide protein [Ralstonia pseudosolanacearum GMI1000]|uniref:Hypothetical signal peptide protein n=1 Tax=Ralstonia nicotianae (strain ATCC BAA-1114 / GMI1000) TaxID=267608 RepID=Q8Y2T3_RALN1|nr:hypothetical signal peptide protein [Ralstonia pseudosolanacearum GMI1000]